MELILSQWWNSASILSEFISALFLTIGVAFIKFYFEKMGQTKKSIRYFLVPTLYGIVGTIAIYIGFGFGQIVESGNETSLMSLPFTLIKAIYFNTYNLVIVAVIFQIIGSFVGIGIYLLIAKLSLPLMNKNAKIYDGLIINENTSKEFGAKEWVAQLLFVIILLFTSSTDFGFSIKGNIYFGIFISSLFLIIEFMIFRKVFFFMLSPQLVLVNLIAGYKYGITTKKAWLTLGYQFIIQITALSLVSYPEYTMRIL